MKKVVTPVKTNSRSSQSMREDCEINYKDAVFKISTTKQKLKQKEYLQTGEIPVIDQGQDIIGGYTNDKNRILNCKLPVIVFGDHTKNVKLIKFPFAPGADGTKVLEPKTYISPSYLYYVTEVLVFKIKDKGYARHYQYIEKENFPLVSLPVQKAIVNKIEKLFSSLDSGIADLKKAQDQLVIYRQAVLKKAFEGDWKTTTVGELFDFIGGGTPSKREPNYWNGNIPWASVKDIKGDYLSNTRDYITKQGLDNSSANLAKKDEIILITRISPGKSIISEIDTAINQDLKIVKPKFDTFNKFIHYLFKSTERKIVKLSSGTTVKGINLNNLKAIDIPKIELKEQHQIVQEIESRLSVCDTVEKDIADSLQKAQALRQSILKKAFEGRLLSEEEIATCKADAAYEPASVLLEKIKAEKKQK
ncbi:MAG: restriction endonuclease subunit S [Winogradskyella sp.]